MADNKTNYLENRILDHVLAVVPFSAPAAVYVALYTAAPGEAGGGTEVSGNGYARVQAIFGAASGGQSTNSASIVFAKSTAAWGNVTHFAICDAPTGGNLLYHGPLSAAINVNAANIKIEFEIGTLIVAES
jgi:hypothetical protein